MMKKDHSAEGKRTVRAYTLLYLAFELSNTKWKLTFNNGSKNRFVKIDTRDLNRFHRKVAEAKKRLELASNAQIVSCYEAGRDEFWIHRFLTDGHREYRGGFSKH